MARQLATYQSTEKLANGQRLHLRAIRPQDRERLRAEFLKLSKASVRDRFFSIKLDLTPKELDYLTEVDFDQHVAIVAELDTGSMREPVAVGRLVRLSGLPEEAEIAITVADAMQGMGIGKILLRHLVDCARELGVRQLDATVLAGNTRMMRLIRKSGLPFTTSLHQGIQTITVDVPARSRFRWPKWLQFSQTADH